MKYPLGNCRGFNYNNNTEMSHMREKNAKRVLGKHDHVQHESKLYLI